jgi:hypothetical protein
VSEPKRYERCYHKDYIPEGMEEHYNGKWVSYADYARLKAEVERLRKAGIAMGMCLPDTDEANKAYRDFENGGQS